MKILITGKGGREHALVTALSESSSRPELYAYPGSDAIGELATRVDAADLTALVTWMKETGIDLCVAGEEAWLAQGLADRCKAAGIRIWGPIQEAAQLETSKKYAKEFMDRHHIPTAEFKVVGSAEELEAAIDRLPIVLKYDGLAAGKGVSVCFNQLQVEAFKRQVFTDQAFGEGEVVVEQFLDGNELSVICAVMDQEVLVFTPARDYKRQLAGDNGPNTGGMGAVASRALIDSDWMARIENELIRPTIQGLQKDGLSYQGFLYFGCMLTRKGPELLEYNCRFGDPEAQAILPLVSGDFAGFLYDAAGGTWSPELLEFNDDWSMCLVFASGTYPASGDSGNVITGIHDTAPLRVYHAGTRKNADGDFETNGGRILALAHRADNLDTLRQEVYEMARRIQFDGAQTRPDIGLMHFESGKLITPEDA
jgi:phosphoribosylamine--glycine ligase